MWQTVWLFSSSVTVFPVVYVRFLCHGVRIMTSVPHAGDYLADLWRFDTSTRGWDRVDITTANGASPSGRASHVMTSIGLDLWLHGGSGDTYSGEGDTCSSHTALLLRVR
jgi:hypothetical protein